ncbi:MAG: peptidoglycan DD-metalloendopeptidase family protein [Pseudomonadales bacterium]|nr:peptidoglycan DD-metalloendopeptidase family protein [Pseudomonadales bacterium]MBO6566735.1 peptidoglycan DD-metalloendopeptidase family protein [Pseudomonadales bacterium]MBO6597484.1 peptidoglycan DD-metalloendopeptidase family protein [Pseudomonadales bacterium]MBO6659029.1 peptidoglycan DD-metalloendopeptidase family protein [Pseudomonadales bacterium]MBO6824218.1 peptidoglycan DD-metalloendopeptidase family protein [Pseudomonadales bacterium]
MEAYPKSHVKAAVILTCVVTLVALTLPAQENEALSKSPVSLDLIPVPAAEAMPLPNAEAESISAPTTQWREVTVQSGDSLALLFKRNGLSAADLQHILELSEPEKALKKILPGQTLGFQTTSSGQLMAVRYKKNALDTLLIQREGDKFRADWQFATPEIILAYASAEITRERPSLYHAGKGAGMSDNVIMKLANIFQWDISFALDLREGDRFSLMYEEIYVDGELVKEGDIVAANFQNMGRKHNAVRYTDITGRSDYYTPDGMSMRKAFIRDPVHFTHISSRFNPRRLHPIHKRVMPHRGIDYAAPQGTPVVASGHGKVSIRRQNDASGKYIVIQHGEQYTTKYLHLSAFAKGIKPGATVNQGQTIGYVGATGWATAPHLHYEFLVNGVHRNPKTVTLPKALPIATDEMQRFKNSISPVLAQLNAVSGSGFASRGSADSSTGGD